MKYILALLLIATMGSCIVERHGFRHHHYRNNKYVAPSRVYSHRDFR